MNIVITSDIYDRCLILNINYTRTRLHITSFNHNRRKDFNRVVIRQQEYINFKNPFQQIKEWIVVSQIHQITSGVAI